MPLSEHVYGVAVAFKMTEHAEQWICIKFALSLSIPLQKPFRWCRRPQLWATGDWQLHHDNVSTHASRVMQSFLWWLVMTSNHPGDSAPIQPKFGALWLLAFPKTKVTLKGKRFRTIDELQENMTGSWWQLGELCEVPRCLLWRGLRHHCPMYNVSCILYLLE